MMRFHRQVAGKEAYQVLGEGDEIEHGPIQ
jgi:hypothetical protein